MRQPAIQITSAPLTTSGKRSRQCAGIFASIIKRRKGLLCPCKPNGLKTSCDSRPRNTSSPCALSASKNASSGSIPCNASAGSSSRKKMLALQIQSLSRCVSPGVLSGNGWGGMRGNAGASSVSAMTMASKSQNKHKPAGSVARAPTRPRLDICKAFSTCCASRRRS